jgi:uncharacterized protein YndB with AHSA1/START domain
MVGHRTLPGAAGARRRNYWTSRFEAQDGVTRREGATNKFARGVGVANAAASFRRTAEQGAISMAGPLNAATFRVERSTVIQAPAEAIFPRIDDFRAWADWSPYEKMDANLAKTYAGPARGKGAAYAWVGRKSGSGRMEIVKSEPPCKIVIRLDFTRPMTAHNTAEFTLEPQGSATKVTWAMHGPNTLMSKVMGLFLSMDKLVGPQFEEGLASLKRLAEAAPVA